MSEAAPTSLPRSHRGRGFGSVRTPGAFSGFSGVALADILANGVSIIVLLIVVSLMVRYEQEQEKLEQTEDVSVLLSRELASSFVMNALPTSPPAVLHDYVNSPHDINPSHDVMPIIELRKGFIRDYYTGRTWPRNELLRQDNGFDHYLRGLAPEQLRAVRIDVYNITEFYITMSILKQHDHQPNHWHFLTGGAGGSGLSVFGGGQGQGVGAGFETGEGEGAGEMLGDAGPLPGDVSVADSAGSSYGYGGAGSGMNFGAGARNGLDLPGMGRDGEGGEGSEFSGEGDGDGSGSGQGRIRFRSAAPRVAADSPLEGLLDQTDLFTLVRALYLFMEQVQADTDNNLPSALHDYDFVRQVLGLVPLLPPLTDPGEVRRMAELTAWLGLFPWAEGAGLELAVNEGDVAPGLVAALAVNRRLQGVEVLRNEFQPVQDELPETVRLGLRLGIHPEIHQGAHTPVEREGVIMMPPAQPDPRYRWRVVTLVDARLSDFITGFVYAAIDEDGRLLMPVDVNAVAMDGLRLNPHLPVVERRAERWWLLFFTLVLALAAFGRLVRRGRTAERGRVALSAEQGAREA